MNMTGAAVLEREPVTEIQAGPFHWKGRIEYKVEKFDALDMESMLRPHFARRMRRRAAMAIRHPRMTDREAEALFPLWQETPRRGASPFEVIEGEGNLLVNQGIQRFEDLLIAVAVQAYDNTHCRLGVGDGTTAAAATDSDMSAAAGSTHRQFVVMDSTFPSRSSQTLTFKATHTSGLSNFHWQEWMIDNGTANGTTVVANALNHKVTDLGTKVLGTVSAFSVTLVLS